MKTNLRFSPTVRRLLTVGGIGILIISSFLLGNVTGYLSHSAMAADEPSEFKIFWEAWDLVQQHFVDQDKIDVKQMTYGAIDGMLSTLGDEGHTSFLSPDAAEMEQSRLEGSFEGIGAYVSEEDGNITIVAPISGSPAEAAGILAGDIVLAVDGEPVDGLSLNQVIDKIRGPANTQVVLTVLHPESEETADITVVRKKIELDSVNWSVIPGTNLAFLEITQFAADTGDELEKALREILETQVEDQPIQGIVLDLRNNPGGYLREAIRVGSQFLRSGNIILMEADAEKNTTVYRSEGRGYAREIPIVVLINEGTASAGEITAGAIKENGRGQLVGQTTFGTGTVLTPFRLSDGSVLRLGVSNWLTPEGNLIKGQGIAPDFEVEQAASTPLLNPTEISSMTEEEVQASEDTQFLRALEMLNPSADSAASTNSRSGRNGNGR